MADDAHSHRGLKALRPPVQVVPWKQRLRNGSSHRIGRIIQLAWYHPLLTIALALTIWAMFVAPLLPPIAAALAISLSGWLMLTHPELWTDHLHPRLLACRRGPVYRWNWVIAMEDAHIIEKARPAPMLVRCWSTWYSDRLTVRMVGAQKVKLYQDKAEDIAAVFGAGECRVYGAREPIRPTWYPTWMPYKTRTNFRRITIVLFYADLLRDHVIPFPTPTTDVLPRAGIAMAKREDDKPWILRYTHILLVGASRSGKSWFIWAIIWMLYPAMRAGLAQLWVIDPKRHELGIGRHLYHRFANSGIDSYVALLEEAVEFMEERQKVMDRLGLQEYSLGLGMFQVWVLVDELMDVVNFPGNLKMRRRAEAALGKLLSQGVAAGVFVVGALQRPDKKLNVLRDWFLLKICFRVTEEIHGKMALGVPCDAWKIPDEPLTQSRWKGYAFALDDGWRIPVKIRGPVVTKDMIRSLPGLDGMPAHPEPGPPQPLPPAHTRPELEAESASYPEVSGTLSLHR